MNVLSLKLSNQVRPHVAEQEDTALYSLQHTVKKALRVFTDFL